MPTYEYQCRDCETTFEVRRAITEHSGSERPACPECGSRKTRRLLSSFFPNTSSKT